MRALFIFLAICGLVFMGAKWFTTEGLPKMNQKKLNKAAKDYYAKYGKMPESLNQLNEFIPVNDIKPPYKGSWILDPEDKETPVKIYRWKYFKCPKDNELTEVEGIERPAKVRCEKCGTEYWVEEEELIDRKQEKIIDSGEKTTK